MAGEVHGLDTADLLAGRTSNGLDGNGGAGSVGSSHEGAALDGGGGQAGQGAEGLGAVAGSHCDGLVGRDDGMDGEERKEGRGREEREARKGRDGWLMRRSGAQERLLFTEQVRRTTTFGSQPSDCL